MASLESRFARWKLTATITWAVIGILVLVAVAGFALNRISAALTPFILAFLLVFFMHGPVSALVRRGLARTWAVLLCFVAGFVALTIVGVFLLPPAGRQIVDFAETVPEYVSDGQALLTALEAQFSDLVVPTWLAATVESVAQSLSQFAVRIGQSVAEGLLSAGSGLASLVFELFLALVVAFWTLKDLPKIREELRSLAGEKYEEDLENLVSTVVRVVGGYLKGQTIVSLMTGTLAGIGLAVLGVPYALVLAIVTFIFNYVPYVGPILSGVLAALVGVFVSPWTAVLAIAVVVAAQQVTDLFVTPRVMSEQVDLHPILVVFSLLVGGTLFGFWGMILAIPVAATGKGLFVYYYERKTNRLLGTENGALFRTSQCDDPDVICDEPTDGPSPEPSK